MKQTKKISELRNWEDNPRGIKKEKFEELKKRISRFGQIKPVLCTPDGEVLGGNMRLRAMRELGVEDVWVSIIEPKTEAEKVEIALTDNEEMGYYEDQALAELIEKYKEEIDLTMYSVYLKEPETLQQILDKFSVDEYDEEFTLAEGEKSGFGQMTFTLADEQADVVKEALTLSRPQKLETYENQNSNGNAIYWICKQWLAQKK